MRDSEKDPHRSFFGNTSKFGKRWTMGTHFFTSVAVNYLPKARVLARSILRFHPEARIHLVLCDSPPRSFHLADEPFHRLWTLADLGLPPEPSWLFRHNLVELSTAVKGFALMKLLELEDCRRVVYLDPDIVVLAPLDGLLSEFERASILLTPHVTQPDCEREAIEDHEVSSLRHGVFNLGFLGVRKSPQGLRFAHWWRARLRDFCRDDIPAGLFTDQRWADLIPALFEDHAVLRHPGYNVCTWNLTHRKVTGAVGEDVRVNGETLVFYHFSGFDRGAQKWMLDKYGASMPALYRLREWYQSACAAEGQDLWGNSPWAYATFDDGTFILPAQREEYGRSAELQKRFPNPYLTSEASTSFLDWWNLHLHPATAPFSSPHLTPSPETPTSGYRIFVLVTPSDLAYATETITLLRQQNFSPCPCHLVSSQSCLNAFPIPEGWTEISVRSDRYEDLFATVLDRFADQDMLILRAGMCPPAMWDLRLAWSAARSPDALTISPIDRRMLDPLRTLGSGIADEDLDQLCYWYRRAADSEIEAFVRDCVYVRHQAWQELAADLGSRRPADLITRAHRYRFVHRLAAHICLGGPAPLEEQSTNGVDKTGAALLQQILFTLRAQDLEPEGMLSPRKTMAAPNLHITHSLGGGTEFWLKDYCATDRRRDQLVLRSFGTGVHHGTEWQLYRYGEHHRHLLRTWRTELPIKAAIPSHPQVREILREIQHDFSPGQVLVSSLIGHSFDCFRLGLPVTVICHDYFPFCMALNVTFGGTCRSCEPERLRSCIAENPFNKAFRNVPANEWLTLRSEFVEAVRASDCTFAAPSPSVIESYRHLLPGLLDRFQLIPHGLALRGGPLRLEFDPRGRLRLLILGQLPPLKGRHLLEAMLPELERFADITLLGGGESTREIGMQEGVRVIEHYDRHDLPRLVGELAPEIGLLLSPATETFSYTLRELQALAIPTLATRRGSFMDWIQDGITGLLAAPEPEALLKVLRRVAADKSELAVIHQRLRAQPAVRTPADMVADYDRLHPPEYAARRYFEGPRAPQPLTRKAIQVYWRSGEHFDEFASSKVFPRGPARQTLRVAIPRQRDVLRGLRLDFGNESALLRMYSLTLFDADEKVVWDWGRDPALWKHAYHQQIVPWRADAESATLALTGSDAHLLLPLNDHQLKAMGSGGSLAVDLAFDNLAAAPDGRTVQQILLDMMHSLRTEHLKVAEDQVRQLSAENETLRRAAEQTRQQKADMEDQLHASQEKTRQLTESLSWRLTHPFRRVMSRLRGQN